MGRIEQLRAEKARQKELAEEAVQLAVAVAEKLQQTRLQDGRTELLEPIHRACAMADEGNDLFAKAFM